MTKESPLRERANRPLSRQRALRMLAEGAKPTLELLADASARSLRTLRADAKKEGWAIGREPEPDIGARLRAMATGLLDKVEALQDGDDGKNDRQEIDTLLAMIRGLEKIDEILRSEESARENQIRRDEDLADVLDRVNERIVRLAKEFAAAMVAQGAGPVRGEPG
ncbi:hypothetical protein RB623_22735 [Mesorhizobium sp. LHD-90]|uniref:hypothetical protein n=1 Tax=Mesorhizobium sp. LHD-90 TaxID=3071414 RepID=UPI0027E1E191|nr:hypothetical protein [Mesorhizobium sp. LHD-90]MDQ6436876.1 hypothetical protein [Mesorhizobium sp. LHD-90]